MTQIIGLAEIFLKIDMILWIELTNGLIIFFKNYIVFGYKKVESFY
jgi:hypothetical protein